MDDGIDVTVSLTDEFSDSANRVAQAMNQLKTSFSSITDNVKQLGKSFSEDLGKSFDTVTKYAGYVGTSLVGAFGLLAREVIHQSEELVHLNEVTGISIERLQELGLAAQTHGSSLEGMAQGMRRMSMMATQAAEGSTRAEAAFEKLGVSIYDSNGNLKETNELFNDVANGFANIQGHTEKVSLAMELFGRAGANLLPVLEQGAEGFDKYGKMAQGLGIIMSKDAVEASEKLKNEWGVLLQVGKALVAEGLMYIEDHMPVLIDWFIKIESAVVGVRHGWRDLLTDTSALGGALIAFGKNLYAVWQAMNFDFSGIEKMRTLGDIWDEASAKMKKGHAENDALAKDEQIQVDALGVKLQNVITVIRGVGEASKEAGKEVEKMVDPLEKLTGQFQKSSDMYMKTGDATAYYKENVKSAQKALEDYARTVSVDTATPQQIKNIENLRAAFEQAKKEEEHYTSGQQEAKRQSEEFNRMLVEGANLAKEYGMALDGMDLADIAEEAQETGKSMSQMFKEMEEAKNTTLLGGLDSALRDFSKKIADMKGLFLNFFNSIESGMSKAFESMMESGGKWTDAMKGFFDDIKKSFYKMVSDMVSREIMAQIFGGAGGGFGSFFGGGGGSMNPTQAAAAAAGGGGGGGGLMSGGGGLLGGLVGGIGSLFGIGGAGGQASGLDVNGNADYNAELAQMAGGGSSGLSLGGLGLGLAGTAMGTGLAIQGVKSGNVTQSTLGGALAGFSLGATVGSIIPGIGTVIGGVVGAIGGAITGFISGRRKKRKKKREAAAAAAAAAAQQAAMNNEARLLVKEDIQNKFGGGNAITDEVENISKLLSGDVSDDEIAKLGGAQAIIQNAQGIQAQSAVNATNNKTVNVGAPVINVSVGSIGDNYDAASLAQDLGYHLVNTIQAGAAGV